MKITNKRILITGGTSGIGLILGRKLKKQNNEVILMGTHPEKLLTLRREGFTTLSCDLSDPAHIENSIVEVQNKYHHIDILFNNAGVQYNFDLTGQGYPLEKIQKEIAINVTGQIILTQLLLPLLHQSTDPKIILTTSGLGAFPKQDGLNYSATKAAMRNFTIGLRYALKNTHIQVYEFIPPVTDTGMTSARSEGKMSPEVLVDQIIPQLERGRKVLTVRKMRLFLWIAFLFPGIAHKIIS